MKLIVTFVAAIATGIVVALGTAGSARAPATAPVAGLHALTADIDVADQLSVEQVAQLGRQGYDAIIALRPDGEAPGQVSSYDIGAEARSLGIAFAYVPVPHGEIPDSAVAALDQALTASGGRVLLYCRTGKRAARTWSLMEASRPGGRSAAEILAAVRGSGQSADDLAAAIAHRIAQRKTALVAQQ